MKLTVQELTAEAFAPYGTFFNIHEGFLDETISFQPDRMLQYTGSSAHESLCSIRIHPRPFELTVTEYHKDCEEVFGGYTEDMLFHVGCLDKNNLPDPDTLAVFRLPAGTFCRVKRQILHHAPFALSQSACDGLVLLTPAAYTIDCHVLNFDIPIEIEI